ncbi:LutC/YkgG family protein [Yinghuangia seranimata]|uniref:LutC/YkgG family protein n=1 Tax=Yinghuangia seranimata TaxID=408067 RepID=UPI00248C1824|nr:LUD domain-containing protein [Yinghuangia seranimata]MDI2129393.1 LUD domain-containing protein [Yinghuangia seranimata]
MTDSRDLILGRIRSALVGVDRAEHPANEPVARDYHDSHTDTGLANLLARNLTDYRAHVHRAAEAELPGLIGRLLAARGARTLAVPPGLPTDWLPGDSGTRILHDDGTLTATELDRVDSVLTGCAVAIAETGTLVLDAGPDQGRRMLTLVPDHHICVVRTGDQIVASVPQALRRLDPERPQTWISGPSATSDIELNRVEGVHGPRTLDVVLIAEG